MHARSTSSKLCSCCVCRLSQEQPTALVNCSCESRHKLRLQFRFLQVPCSQRCQAGVSQTVCEAIMQQCCCQTVWAMAAMLVLLQQLLAAAHLGRAPSPSVPMTAIPRDTSAKGLEYLQEGRKQERPEFRAATTTCAQVCCHSTL
jgi:hypothetical protein